MMETYLGECGGPFHTCGIGTKGRKLFFEILSLDLCLWTGRGGNWQI